jgi:hypothetical protein
MSKGKNQYVVRHSDDWAVRGEGNKRITSKHETQKDAIKEAIEIAKKEKSEVFIQGRNGKWRDRESYGPDPCPPKDNRH